MLTYFIDKFSYFSEWWYLIICCYIWHYDHDSSMHHFLCAAQIISFVNNDSFCKQIGWIPWILPLHSYIPSVFGTKLRLLRSCLNFSLLSNLFCSLLRYNFLYFSVSDVVKGPDSLEWWQFFINEFTQVDTLNTLYNSYCSNNLWNALEISIVFTTICFSNLAPFWDSNDGWITC